MFMLSKEMVPAFTIATGLDALRASSPARCRYICGSAKQCTVVASAEDTNASSTKVVVAAATAAAAALIGLAPVTHFLTGGSSALAAKGGGDTFLFSSGRVNKDAESLLRWSLPISNKPVRELQSYIEDVVSDVKGLKWAKMSNDLKRGMLTMNTGTDAILVDVPEARRVVAKSELDIIRKGLPLLDKAIQDKNADKVISRGREVLRSIGRIEETMVTGFPYAVPSEFENLPQLLGRATVEMEVVKGDADEKFDIEGVLLDRGKLTMVVDGYSAPVNAGAFIDLVNRGFYNGLGMIRSDGFIIQSGKPSDADGFKDESGSLRLVPLEVFAKDDEQPLYGLTLEDDGRGTASTVLPFSSYGTLAMARREFEPNTASSQFFWFLFEPDLTPAGRNLLDGSWSVIGYTVDGEKFLKGLQKGDKIVSATVTSGIENLKEPISKKS